MSDTSLTITAAISVIGAITTIVTLFISSKKISAETEKLKSEKKKTDNEAYLMLIKPLEDQINKTKAEVKDLQFELKIVLAHNIILTKQLCQNGLTPEPAPTTCEEATKIIRAKNK